VQELWSRKSAERRLREINEVLRGAPREFATELSLVCECVHTGCTALLAVPVEIFELVRRQPGRFLLADGHLDADTDDVIAEYDGFVVVARAGVR
jgi:hypothetical protein